MTEDKKKAFMNLYEPVHAKFERFCKARVYGEMDFKDLMHDAILIAFKKFDHLNEPKAFLHFLFGIAIRVLANSNRKKKTLNWAEQEEQIRFATTSNSVDKQMETEHLYAALSVLPEAQQEAIILFEIVGFSIKEIAELQVSGESAVKQRLLRGRQHLLEVLQEKPVSVNS